MKISTNHETNVAKTEAAEVLPGALEPGWIGTSIFSRTSYVDFVTKYKSFYMLGRGGFGCVYAGRRLSDKLPVAIKRIPELCAKMRSVVLSGTRYRIPLEALMMMRAGGRPSLLGQSAAVSILNWYNLEHEVVLVMERPLAAVDLLQYLKSNGPMSEVAAKAVVKQLVDAAVHMQAARVFHRDIKAENVLVERRGDGLRVRVIDFGCARHAADPNSSYSGFSGTPTYAPPEFYSAGSYKAGPTTVWQLGALLCDALDGASSFSTEAFVRDGMAIGGHLSGPCQDFLRTCLTLEPKDRATLEQLKLHPWLADAASTAAIPPPRRCSVCNPL